MKISTLGFIKVKSNLFIRYNYISLILWSKLTFMITYLKVYFAIRPLMKQGLNLSFNKFIGSTIYVSQHA